MTFESNDQEVLREVARVFNDATLDSLKSGTYLELRNGERRFLAEYKNPARDLLGARFRFNRMENGRPFINTDSDELRFHARLSVGIVLDMRLKVADFMYDGVMEY